MLRKYKRGFTLIELLIVIVIIGVLATAVLSAINPIEQVRKAQDAGRRSDSAELLNSMERYFTSFRHWPWCDAPGTTCTPPTGTTVPPAPGSGSTGQAVSVSGTIQPWLTEMISTAELKDEFADRDSLAQTLVFWDSGDLVRICFVPESQSYALQANWSSEGIAPAGSATGTMVCVPE